jgi:hypothetical protein
MGEHTVVVFGLTGEGRHTWGTGMLLSFHDQPIVLTCAHVVSPIQGTIFLSTARASFQDAPLHRRLIVDRLHDWACLELTDRGPFSEKSFYPASAVVSQPVLMNESVLVHGFPGGHPTVQRGAVVDVAARTANFFSTTYLSMTAADGYSVELKRWQKRVEWNANDNRDAKKFMKIRGYTPQELGGVSGAPVALAGERRIFAQVTHACQAYLWCNPLGAVLSALAKRW